MKNLSILFFLFLFTHLNLHSQDKHKFEFSGKDFLLDGKSFQIIGGEMHPARIPHEYWRHRIQMAKAMGCNTISAYVFWNYQEPVQGHFDFKTENRNLEEFIKLVKEEGMWMILRPGPYACAEWDFGGLPPYLLKNPSLKVRCMDPDYISAVKRYLDALAPIVKKGLCSDGGPILMVQIENEYGSYGNDRNYMHFLKNYWLQIGVKGPFYTADGATPYMLEAGSLDSCAIGLDSGSSPEDFAEAAKKDASVPSFSSETYPGWLTHWGEPLAEVKTSDIMKEVRFLLENKKSFNLYVVHGGTNFGFNAGANSGGKGFEPDITSYDYDAPITEQGLPTSKFDNLRILISQFSEKKLPAIPAPISSQSIPSIKMDIYSSIWDYLPPAKTSVQPSFMESYGQYQGFILYRTKLTGHKNGKLKLTELRDFGLVFLNSGFVGSMDRRLAQNSINLPVSEINFPQLDIFVEAMGHINFAQEMIDRKGITERASLNGMTLMNWDVFNFSFDGEFIKNISATKVDSSKRLIFFKGIFNLSHTADTWLDLSNYTKGIIFINGHNLGRYWNIGPQKRLYCPASWLKEGENQILVFDLLQTKAMEIKGFKFAGGSE